ncbi:MAG: hypothetical protein ABRQ23_10270 [Syntrophomonadaceae bacterium]
MEMGRDVQLSTAIKNALLDLEKAETLLLHWTSEYVFEKAPDPKIMFSDRIPPSDLEKLQSAKWFNEYRFISQFILMANDYVTHSKEVLKKVLQAPPASASMGAGEQTFEG